MKRLAEVQSHIASMGSLSDLVGAMRALASMRMQEAQRRADAWVDRHQDAPHPRRAGDAAGMQRTIAAKGDHRVFGQILAILHRMDPRRIGHVLVDHLRQTESRRLRIHPQRFADIRLQGRRRPPGIKRDRPPREIPGIEPPQRQIRIRHRRMRPAAPIARRSRLGPGGFRPHPDLAHRIHMGQRPAPGADLHHVDHGDRDRHPRPLLEPIGPRHLEHPRGLRHPVADQADLCRGPPHVETQHLVEPVSSRHMRREHRPPGRPGFHQPHRKLRRALDRDDPPARMHQEHGATHPFGPQPRLQPPQIALHQRLDIGVGDGGIEPLILPHLRTDLARQRHHRPRQLLRQHLPHHPLMRIVLIGMQQPYRHRGKPRPPQPLRQRLHLRTLQRN